MEKLIEIEPYQLRPGMYVHLDLGWMGHPFPFSRFKIKTKEQIQTIHSLGLKTVRYCPEKSDSGPLQENSAPLPHDTAATDISDAAPEALSDVSTLMAEKLQRREHLDHHRTKIIECQKILVVSTQTMRKINSDVFARPQASVQAASDMIDGFMDILLSGVDTVLYSVNDKMSGGEIYNHSVNVSILATLLAKDMGYPRDVIKQIGLGCLFHDIGMHEVTSLVTMKAETLTASEKALLEEHCVFGERIARDIGLLPAAFNIVMQHHELLDGSGYPKKFKGEQIFLLAQLVAIIEIYDQLCNTLNPANDLTPHEALSQLFARYRTKLNAKMLQAFIRLMGVYPPGSVVSLSNDIIGIVLSVTSKNPLKPTLMVYDPEIPREEALLLDLSTAPEINITRAIRPSLLPPEVFEYLSPSKRATYFFDSGNQST